MSHHHRCLQVLGIQPMDASDNEEEDSEADQSGGASSADEDIDDLDDLQDDSSATSSSSGASDEGKEADAKPRGTDRNPTAAKKQRIAGAADGLGSVGWDASDDEEGQAMPVAAGVPVFTLN